MFLFEQPYNIIWVIDYSVTVHYLRQPRDSHVQKYKDLAFPWMIRSRYGECWEYS